jgi:magnesium chelatase family protein
VQELARIYGNKKVKVPEVKVRPQVKKAQTFDPRSSDLKHIVGQEEAKLALEITAAGMHNLMMTGTPGTGKSMLAECLPGILPDLKEEDAIEVTKVHSVAGTLDTASDGGLVVRPPYENPHHTATPAAIIGGGSGIARPGAVSRAHKGVLFLDEAPEFSASVLQTLRQPLELGEVIIQRAAGVVKYPAKIQLVMAANPCPCGRWTGQGDKCSCTPLARRRYMARISGPLLDRMDLHVNVRQVSGKQIFDQTLQVEDSAAVRKRVVEARRKQEERLKKTPWRSNSEVPGSWLRKIASKKIIDQQRKALNSGLLTMRGVDRVLRVSWTIADLKGLDEPTLDEVDLATFLRVNGAM